MSAASVLSFSPSAMPGPVMPMDVAMHFYISHSPPPLRGFLSSYEELQRAKNRANQSGPRGQNQVQNHQNQKPPLFKPLRPCLSRQQRAAERGVWSSKAEKKRVVFADTKGMSLTAVHVFSKFDDEPFRNKRDGGGGGGSAEDLQFDMTDLETAAMELKITSARSLALDFKPPSADYLDFRNRLIRNSVCLENCSLQERSLTGTVKVRNLGFQKAVQIRVTFDSWASFTDVDCSFMNNVYGCQDTDTFAFELELPADVPPAQRVEFCVLFTAQEQKHWDNNDGRNYVLKHVGWNGQDLPRAAPPPPASVEQKKPAEQKSGGVKLLDLDFDQFGSPRTSSGLFPGWQSWGAIDSAVPYW